MRVLYTVHMSRLNCTLRLIQGSVADTGVGTDTPPGEMAVWIQGHPVATADPTPSARDVMEAAADSRSDTTLAYVRARFPP